MGLNKGLDGVQNGLKKGLDWGGQMGFKMGLDGGQKGLLKRLGWGAKGDSK